VWKHFFEALITIADGELAMDFSAKYFNKIAAAKFTGI
jgi:hypothetical protein